ncbi:SMP-30/gluconolactonase/LRE family protein [Pedobacter psychroterrae]|uniref:SMP-30/gluconolactonase/LRE family protein n=1 Tax=Pedobacter psychroterrae TaxID=2530453 RepID=A0A4V2ML06_9SPHI|nr:SMP-30/gluconolactonase/LRE family protein [Pedobacter psychroterrae]TCD00217.1 SMP-30/gluconolactonase/LRE family protein [Pedobacter psychroterrae]
MTVSTLYKASNVLGESPFWHAKRQSLFWVDIEQGILHELDWKTKNAQTWRLGRRVSLIIEGNDDQLTLGVQGGLISMDLQTGEFEWLADIEKHIPDRRCNDGGVDSKGRIWIGVMDIHCKAGHGSLYRLANLSAPPVKMLEELTIPNGLVWSHNNDRMYFIDTVSRSVKSYLFNVVTGAIEYEKDAINIPPQMGMPDGITIDNQGMLWVALYGGFALGRWNPLSGKLIDLIKLPVPNVTNCCFAGDQLDELVITTARENLTPQQLSEYPESGNLFIIKSPGVKGVKVYSENAT